MFIRFLVLFLTFAFLTIINARKYFIRCQFVAQAFLSEKEYTSNFSLIKL